MSQSTLVGDLLGAHLSHSVSVELIHSNFIYSASKLNQLLDERKSQNRGTEPPLCKEELGFLLAPVRQSTE